MLAFFGFNNITFHTNSLKQIKLVIKGTKKKIRKENIVGEEINDILLFNKYTLRAIN